MENSRRDFVKKTVLGTTALSVGAILPGFSAKSYGRIIGSNSKIVVAMMGRFMRVAVQGLAKTM